MSALNADTCRLDSYLLDLFVRFAGILPMNYPIPLDDGRFRFDPSSGG